MTRGVRNRIQVKLIGGSRDGVLFEVWTGQPLIYITQALSFDDAKELRTSDETIGWKWPEDVYDRKTNTEYIYRHTVHYKPREDGNQIQVQSDAN